MVSEPTRQFPEKINITSEGIVVNGELLKWSDIAINSIRHAKFPGEIIARRCYEIFKTCLSSQEWVSLVDLSREINSDPELRELFSFGIGVSEDERTVTLRARNGVENAISKINALTQKHGYPRLILWTTGINDSPSNRKYFGIHSDVRHVTLEPLVVGADSGRGSL